MSDFHAERLSVPGFTPMPAVPAAWAGKVPDQAQVKKCLMENLTALTIRQDCSLVIPADADVPVEINAELAKLLTQLRTQFPAPQSTRPATDPEGSRPPPCDQPATFASLTELLSQLQVVKTIRTATYNLLVASKLAAGFDVEDCQHAVWIHNPSATKRIDLESDADICGAAQCRFVKEDSPQFDTMAPCSVRVSFHRPGVDAGRENKDVDAGSAKIFYKDSSATKLLTVEELLKDALGWPPKQLSFVGKLPDKS